MYFFTVNDRVKPQKVVATEGQVLSIKCETEEEAHWFFNHRSLPSNVEKSQNYIVIRNIDQDSIGNYECISKVNSRFYYSYFSYFSATAKVIFKSKLNRYFLTHSHTYNILLYCRYYIHAIEIFNIIFRLVAVT